MMKIKVVMLLLSLFFISGIYAKDKDKEERDGRKIQTEKFEDKITGCKISYEYYKAPDGRKILHGKYKRQWSLPKGHRSNWSGNETVTATFVEDKLNGTVVINCEKYKWKRKNEFIKGKGRQISLVPVESYVARNLKIEVKNDTLTGSFNFELGNYKYEAQGKVNGANELEGKYILYMKNTSDQTDNPKNIKDDWVVSEQYVCDPSYTYKDAIPVVKEVVLGYPGTSKGELIRIKIPRLRLSINPSN